MVGIKKQHTTVETMPKTDMKLRNIFNRPTPIKPSNPH